MKKILIVASILCINILHAQTSVYKVNGNGTTMYLGGTIHLLQKADFPLPDAYEKAYKASSLLVFETNMDNINQAEMGKMMLTLSTYTEDKTLKTELNKANYKKLSKAFEKEGLRLALFEKTKPMLAVLTLTMLKLQKMDYTADGVDAFFEAKAKEDKLEIKSLENPEFQIKLLAAAGDDNPNTFVAYSLRDIEKMETDFEEMKTAWRTGDAEKLEKTNTEMLKDFPDMHEKLLVFRNNNWMKKMMEYLETPETEFILVGALHLHGKFGLLKQLKKLGFTIEQLK